MDNIIIIIVRFYVNRFAIADGHGWVRLAQRTLVLFVVSLSDNKISPRRSVIRPLNVSPNSHLIPEPPAILDCTSSRFWVISLMLFLILYFLPVFSNRSAYAGIYLIPINYPSISVISELARTFNNYYQYKQNPTSAPIELNTSLQLVK